jgi:uncharacterized membrane protein
MAKKTLVLLCAMAILFLGKAATAGEPFKVTANYTVENSFYRLTIDTERGGAIRSFRLKTFDPDKEWIYPDGGGFLEDKIWQQPQPGELQDFPYESKVLEQTPERFKIELWRAFKQVPYTGLIFRKVITLSNNSPAIQVRMTLENPTDKEMFPGAWIQNRFYCAGSKGDQVMYTPSFMGIRTATLLGGKSLPNANVFVRRPAAPWAMTFEPKAKVGMLFLADFNYLQQFYTCLPYYTTEVFYDRVLLRPGKSWSSDYTLVPVSGVGNCFHADTELFISATQDKDVVTFAVRAVDAPVAQATIDIKVDSSDRSEKLAEKSVSLKDLSAGKPQGVAVTIPGAQEKPVIVAMTITTQGKSRTAEFMYSANDAFYQLQESAVTFRATMPKKLKPELMGDRNLKLTPHQNLSVFYGLGLWHEYNRIEEILRELDPKTDFKTSYFKTGTLGPELSTQPLLAEELMVHDLVVLNNVGANAFGEAGEIAVEQYVKAGGALLVCGGVLSLGKSRWDESPLAAVLPVETAGSFDLERLTGFQAIEGGKNFGSVEWIQRVKSVKLGAKVLLTVGGKPLLVEGPHGKGKVLVWLGTPMGEPPTGIEAYWKSENWKKFMKKIIENILPEIK